MSDIRSSEARLLRDDSETFDALRDGAAERFAIDSSAVEKEYWALEALRAATAPLDGVDEFVFKGGTSLSKAYGIIERFSEDIDLLVITTATGKALKRVLRPSPIEPAPISASNTNARTREGVSSTLATRTRHDAKSNSSAPVSCSKFARRSGAPISPQKISPSGPLPA